MSEEEGAKPSARADLISGGLWVVIGAAIAIGSWRMDRLESQGVPAVTAPGLVPGILGVLIVLTAVTIMIRALRAGALYSAGSPASRTASEPGTAKRSVINLLVCLGFSAGLVGHGLPFWAAAFIYLFTHITLLQYPERRAAGQVGRGLLVAAAIALGASAGISLIFQELFLVRLP